MARRLGKHLPAVRLFVGQTGGRRRPPPRRAESALTAAEREEVSRGLAAALSYRAIAVRRGRSRTTVSREVARNGGRAQYRAGRADRPALRVVVAAKLEARWSPEQIACWLKRAHPDDASMRVAHETTYRSLFVQGRGALRRELTRPLRTGRAMRFPRGARTRSGQGRGQLRDTVSIRERPAEGEDRAVPGHWEGDLIFGRRPSAVGTLVERTGRYVQLVPTPAGYTAPAIRDALAAAVARLPEQLRRSLTWDRGKERAQHVQFTVASGVQVYCCDPRSPWQRGPNENTNGLLRQYRPQRSASSGLTQADLDAIAAELNGRPRDTLGWRSPAARCAELAGAG